MAVQKQPLDCAGLPLPDYGSLAVAAFLIKRNFWSPKLMALYKPQGAVIQAGEAVISAIA